MPLPPGTRIGSYEIVSALGAGGMGEVYRARDAKLGRDVAIKVLLDSVANDTERLARFEREARTLAQLNHPNIAHLHGFEDDGRTRALVMELVAGDDLSMRIARGPLSLDEAAAIARQIIDALAAAHDAGIVHRDLKPGNVKVRDDGTVKVLDFGLAKAMDPAARSGAHANVTESPTITSPAMTAAGIILGTAAYMSPEQAKGRPVDKRADIWAFGCVLYEMLTGRRAFPGDDVSDTLATVLKSDPDWTLLPTGTPASIRRLLQRTLDKRASHRLADIADARFDLNELVEPVATAAPPKSRSSPGVGATAAFAAGVVLTAIAAYGLLRSPAVVPPGVVRFSIPYKGSLRGFSVSPDGRTIAYALAGPEGGAGVWLRRVDSETSTLVPNSDDAWAPFWSPDGNAIGFFAGSKLRSVDVSGRSARTVCDVGPGSNGGARGSWGDGVIVFTKNLQAFKVLSVGGRAEALTLRSTAGRIQQAQLAPDSTRVLFVVRQERGGSETWAARLDGTDERKLFDAPSEFLSPDSLLVGRSNSDTNALLQPIDRATLEPRGPARPLGLGSIRAMSARANTMAVQSGTFAIPTELTWFDRSGTPLGVIGEVGDHYMPRLSPDGTKLAVETHGSEGGGDIFVYDVKAGTRTRLTFEPTFHNAGATWSPDGTRLAFHSSRQGLSVFVKPVSGASPEQLLFNSGSANPVDWSPNGQFILIDTNDAPAGIYRVSSSDASKAEPVLVDPKARLIQGQLSPDGTLLAYVSEERPGGEVYVSPFPPTGAKWQVSTKGGHSPRWNRNGRELFYVSPERAIMSVPVVTKGTFSSGTPVMLFQSSIKPRTSDWFHYDVAPDGKRFILVSQRDAAPEPIQVIINWPSMREDRQ